MGSYINTQLPALDIKPQPPIAQQLGQVQQLRNLQQAGQLGQQEIEQNAIKTQQMQQQQTDQQAMTKAMQEWDGKDFNSLPGLVMKHGASATAVMGLKTGIIKQQTDLANLSKDQLANEKTKGDYIAQQIDNVKGLPPEQQPQAFEAAKADLVQRGYLDPQHAQAMQYQGPQQLDILEKTFMGHSAALDAAMKTAETQKNVAQTGLATAETAEHGAFTPDRIAQLNQGLTQRWQVLHPGMPAPAAFTLQPGATPKDFDRTDKLMQQSEASAATQAQRDQSNAIRQQTLSMAQQNQQDRQDREGLQPVIGQDKNGNPVLVSAAEARTMGLTGSMKAGEQEVTKAQAARHWIPLAATKADANAPPEQKGILQLIDDLDKQGKLGVVASRWNDFMAGKVGAGDPEITALRTKMGLSTTLLMNAHVGSRGGSYMLEHFKNLANSGKMDADTLRTGVKSELEYVKTRAMLPQQQGAPQDGQGPRAADPFAQFGGATR